MVGRARFWDDMEESMWWSRSRTGGEVGNYGGGMLGRRVETDVGSGGRAPIGCQGWWVTRVRRGRPEGLEECWGRGGTNRP